LGSAANFSSSCFLFLRTTALFHCLLLTTISHLLLLLSSLSLPSSSFRRSKIGPPPLQHRRNRFPRHVYPTDSTLCSLTTRACNFYMHDHHDPTVYAFISLTSQTHNPSLDRFASPRFRSSWCLFPTSHRPLRGVSLIFSLSLRRREYCPFFMLFVSSSPPDWLFGAGFSVSPPKLYCSWDWYSILFVCVLLFCSCGKVAIESRCLCWLNRMHFLKYVIIKTAEMKIYTSVDEALIDVVFHTLIPLLCGVLRYSPWF